MGGRPRQRTHRCEGDGGCSARGVCVGCPHRHARADERDARRRPALHRDRRTVGSLSGAHRARLRHRRDFLLGVHRERADDASPLAAVLRQFQPLRLFDADDSVDRRTRSRVDVRRIDDATFGFARQLRQHAPSARSRLEVHGPHAARRDGRRTRRTGAVLGASHNRFDRVHVVGIARGRRGDAAGTRQGRISLAAGRLRREDRLRPAPHLAAGRPQSSALTGLRLAVGNRNVGRALRVAAAAPGFPRDPVRPRRDVVRSLRLALGRRGCLPDGANARL